MSNPRLMPEDARLFRAHVVRSERFSPSMQRVTVVGDDLQAFPWRGFDHWFRLFMQLPHQDTFALPNLSGSRWWKRYLAIPEEERPHCANYTVADFRPESGEMDIDFVVHVGPTGALEGGAAIWACAAAPGDALALLDQGVLFDCPEDATELLIAADESGLPATAGILRSLPAHAVGRVIQEVPSHDDRRDLVAPAGIDVTWIVREDGATAPGVAALEEVRRIDTVARDAYAFVVGESTLATEARRHLHRAGLPKSRITFSGFWKREAVATA